MKIMRSVRRVVFLNYMDIKNPLSGGAEEYCFEVAQRLSILGYEVIWVTRRFVGAPRVEVLKGVKIIRVGNRFTVYPLAIIVTLQLRPDLIFESINVIPFFTPLFTRKPILGMIHHIIPHTVIKRKIGWLSFFADFIQLKLLPGLYRETLILANSESTEKDLLLLGFKNVRLTQLGVEIPVFQNAPKKSNIMVAAGALRPWKNPDHILNAFTKVPNDWRLVIFGRPENKKIVPELKRTAQNLGIADRVDIFESITNEQRTELYKISKIAIIASEKEGWGFAAIEPQTFGCPVVGYDVPGIRDSVKNNITGILVRGGSIEYLGESLKKLATDNQLYLKLSTNALQWSHTFTWEHSVEDFVKALETVIEAQEVQVTL